MLFFYLLTYLSLCFIYIACLSYEWAAIHKHQFRHSHKRQRKKRNFNKTSCGEGRVMSTDQKGCMDRNECLDLPCLNGASCINLEPKFRYRCVCLDGFWGENCELIQEGQTLKLSMGALAAILVCLLVILSEHSVYSNMFRKQTGHFFGLSYKHHAFRTHTHTRTHLYSKTQFSNFLFIRMTYTICRLASHFLYQITMLDYSYYIYRY